MWVCASGSSRTNRPARMVGAMTSVVSVTMSCALAPQPPSRAKQLAASRAGRGISPSARGAFRLLAHARFLGVGKSTAYIHEAAPLGALHLLAPRGVGGKPGARWDQSAHDHVFLQATQIILEPAYRGLGEYPGGLLERGGGDERLGGERGLGDAEQHRLQPRRLLAVELRAIVDVERPRAIELLTAQ